VELNRICKSIENFTSGDSNEYIQEGEKGNGRRFLDT